MPNRHSSSMHGGVRPDPRLHRASIAGRQGHTICTDRSPSHGTGRVGFVSPASFNSGLWARLLRRTITPSAVISITPGVSTNFRNSRAGPARAKPFSRSARLAVQQVRQHRQGQVEVHVQPHVAAQAIEVEERDLFTKVVLDVISAGVGLDDFAGRLRLRQVVGQEEGRRLVAQPRHDQLPQVAVVAVELGPARRRTGSGDASPWPG